MTLFVLIVAVVGMALGACGLVLGILREVEAERVELQRAASACGQTLGRYVP